MKYYKQKNLLILILSPWRCTLTILQVQQTRLTHILHFAACLTDLCLLETHPCSRTPAEHSKRSSANLMWENAKLSPEYYETELFKMYTVHTLHSFPYFSLVCKTQFRHLNQFKSSQKDTTRQRDSHAHSPYGCMGFRLNMFGTELENPEIKSRKSVCV